MKKLPTVVIVGRTNVGKSTLFNRLSTGVKSLTLDYEGVTRDFVVDVCCWLDRCFTIVDTGGISLRKTKDPLLEQVRHKAISLLDTAAVILLVVDGKVGLVEEDTELAKFLRKTGKPVVVVMNKGDIKDSQEKIGEFERLGFSALCTVSAQHGTGISELLEHIVHQMPDPIQEEEKDPAYKIALLGKPNVGKSSLMNLLLRQERSIVADLPGTTREAISEKVKFYEQDIVLTDTPGVRRHRSVSEQLETMMVKSALRAVDGANVVLLLVDASQGKIADQELKLAFYVFQELHKALIILLNKQDLVQEITQNDLDMSLDEYTYFTKKVAMLSISCKTGKNVGKILPLAQKVWERHAQVLPDVELTLLVKQALKEKPLYHKTHLLHVYKVKQINTAPVTILLIVNQPLWFDTAQLNFFENLLRQEFDLVGVPVVFVVRSKFE